MPRVAHLAELSSIPKPLRAFVTRLCAYEAGCPRSSQHPPRLILEWGEEVGLQSFRLDFDFLA
eukprot:3086125-Pyramimonas_sp.AAC.1